VEVHHNGFFCGTGVDKVYLDGKVDCFDNIKVQYWSFNALEEISMELGYGLGVPVWWLLPEQDLASGLRLIASNQEAKIMKQVAFKVKNYVLYLDNYNSLEGSQTEDVLYNPNTSLLKVMSPSKVPASARSEYVDDDSDCSSDVDFADSDYDVEEDDDDLFSNNIDEAVVDEGAAKGIMVKAGHNRFGPADNEPSGKGWDELDSDEEELELPESDEEGRAGHNMRSFRPEDLQNPIFKVGMKFSSVEMVRKAIAEYSIKHRVEIKMPINDRRRVKAVCDEGCPWYLYVSEDKRVNCWAIKTYVGNHTCTRKWALKRCTAKWLGNKYLDRFRADEKMSLASFAKTVQLELNLTPSRTKLGRARKHAWDLIYGDEVQQYNDLWDYGQELRKTNPGSSLFLKLHDGCFKSLYFSLDACKRGFLNGCRPVICLDGCHIKTKFGGQLLTAIGIDPNDCIFPVAMAVVEVECLASWKWFLEHLKEDLGIQNTTPFTIMTDKQKGLIPAVQQTFPDSEHRFCVRHLYSNFQGQFKGENLKNQLWACARASTITRWNEEMEKMRVLNKDAHAWLEKLAPNTWVRAFFSEYPKCDILLNNTCEVFNRYIVEARELPILSMLQRIKGQLMARHYNKQKEVQDKWGVNVICPKIRKKLARHAEMANTCYVIPSGSGVFEVHDREWQYNVDIKGKHCDCKRWSLTGIPCSHAISCLRHERIPEESVLPWCYSTEAFK
jgi:hypothetical protein